MNFRRSLAGAAFALFLTAPCQASAIDPCVQTLIEGAFLSTVALPPRLKKLKEAILADLARHLTDRIATVTPKRREKIRTALSRTAFTQPTLLVPAAAYLPHRRAVSVAEAFRGKAFLAFLTVHEFEHVIQDLDAFGGGTVASRVGRMVFSVRSRFYVGEREAHEAEHDFGRRAIALEEREGDLELLMLLESGVPASFHADALDHLSRMVVEDGQIFPREDYEKTRAYQTRKEKLKGYIEADPYLAYLFTLRGYRSMSREQYARRVLFSGPYLIPITLEMTLKTTTWTAVVGTLIRFLLF